MSAQLGIGPGHRVLGRYELVRYVDSGGAGTVWEAHDHTLGQAVALKHVTFPASTPAQQEEADRNRARTLREARFAAQLRNRPHIVAIYDVQEVDGDIWLVLEYLPSHSLRATLAGVEALAPLQVARIGAAVATALAAAHAEGITHRDVKPGNVLLGDDGQTIKLTDFGVAHSDQERGLTSTGIVSGTPAYMAPEQARGEQCTPAADVFSLGATLYRAVEGQAPFGDDENHVALMHRVAYGTTLPPRRAGTFTPLLMHLLEQDPATRPDAATAQRLLDDYARRAVDPTMPTAASLPPSASPTAAPRAVGSVDSVGPAGRVGPGGVTTPGGAPPGAGPGAAPGAGPGSEPGWWRRHRVALVALGVVVALGLAAGAVGLAVALRSDPTAVPDLPDSVRPLAMTGDPTAANPCALIDPAVMARFGTVRVGPGSNLGECRATVDTPDGRRSYTDLHYSDAATEAAVARGPVRDLTGLSIVPAGTTQQGCTTYLRLADSTLVGLSTRRSEAASPPVDPCALTDAASAVAVNRLDDDGITYTPGWQSPITLAGKNACEATGDVAFLPGLDGSRRVGYPNGSNCFIGAGGSGRLYANVYLGLEPDGTMSNYGGVSTVGGKTLYTRGVAGFYSSPACRVYVVHRPSYDAGATRPSEFVAAQLEGARPYDQLCAGAAALAIQAERDVG